jgi:hypothetical protein
LIHGISSPSNTGQIVFVGSERRGQERQDWAGLRITMAFSIPVSWMLVSFCRAKRRTLLFKVVYD